MARIPGSALPPPQRRIFTNRTLNFRSIRAVGFDMDYTLIHYSTDAWEKSAFEQLRQRLAGRGWPVDEVEFDPGFVILGLMLDLERGNVVKANRFGYVKRACHGTRMLSFEEQREAYSRVLVDLAESRWRFLNTFFSISAASMYTQLVDMLDDGRIQGVADYAELFQIVQSSLDEAHAEGQLKGEIIADPETYVLLDEDLPLALLDLRSAGKKLLLITNSEWRYTREMMSFAFDRFLPSGTTWRDLFDLKIVQARKPTFFTQSNPFFEVMDDDGNLQPVVGALSEGGNYLGGCAGLVEQHFGLNGEQILYIGDHIFADVHISKKLLRWRTALVVRQLEEEIQAIEAFRPRQAELARLMAEKEEHEYAHAAIRLELLRAEGGYGPGPGASPKKLQSKLHELRGEMEKLDERIGPIARAYGELNNPRWGLLMRAGNDKSNLARQVERYADVYTSRVSNLLLHTPFVYLRSPHQSLPHDTGVERAT